MSYTKTDWENLPSTSTPLNATNLNKIEQGIYDNAEDISTNTTNIASLTDNYNTITTYSTTQDNAIGTWIDGKTIYRKVLVINGLPNITGTLYPAGLTNRDKVIKLYGEAIEPTNGNSLPLPYVYVGTGSIELAYIGASDSIRITTETDRTIWTGYIFIEYTKTS